MKHHGLDHLAMVVPSTEEALKSGAINPAFPSFAAKSSTVVPPLHLPPHALLLAPHAFRVAARFTHPDLGLRTSNTANLPPPVPPISSFAFATPSEFLKK